jgi:UDP-N-acetylmuramoyl-tripeptide--D-alanyl-D-alanine ligase
MVSRKIQTTQPLIVVKNTTNALDKLALNARNRSKAKFIGVTGSVGKTSIKEALFFLLEKQGKTSASRGSYNNHVGVPITLVNFDPDLDYAVVEMGMNHSGEISKLTKIATPDIRVITGISPGHVGNFENTQGIADAKAEIFEKMTKSGCVVLNKNNEYYDYLLQKAKDQGIEKVYSFGLSAADAFLIKREGNALRASILDEIVDYTLSIEGEHWTLNSLCVLLTLKLAGGDVVKAAKDFENFNAVKGRGATQAIQFEKGKFLLIDDSYNANPDSMRAGIRVLSGKKGRKIAILGDMLELGDMGPKYHLKLAEELLDAHVDKVYACGPLMALLFEMLPPTMKGAWREDSQTLAQDVLAIIEDDDIIFVKGSKGSKMGLIVSSLESLSR